MSGGSFRVSGAIIIPLITLLLLGGQLYAKPSASHLPVAPPSAYALIVGGGPDRNSNQVAIESNVRYLSRLLTPKFRQYILFANGNPHSINVQYLDAENNEHYRKTKIRKVDGPSTHRSVNHVFAQLDRIPHAPILLYFTGHGGPDDADNYKNNYYCLWGEDLTVKQLAAHLGRLQTDAPITLVMVQCFSGAFANLLFKNGNSEGQLINPRFCGFFACVPSREAAGCTSLADEADYRDFTSYFFAALSGTSRLGKPVTGADYDHDGRVGMNEAFAYTLIHDASIDTPVCTSDIFLRRYVNTPNPVVFATSYKDALSWSTPAQQAALQSLSSQIGLSGDNRLSIAFAHFTKIADNDETDDEEEDEQQAKVIRFVRLAKSVVLAHTLSVAGSSEVKARYAALISAEAGNPLSF